MRRSLYAAVPLLFATPFFVAPLAKPKPHPKQVQKQNRAMARQHGRKRRSVRR